MNQTKMSKMMDTHTKVWSEVILVKAANSDLLSYSMLSGSDCSISTNSRFTAAKSLNAYKN